MVPPATQPKRLERLLVRPTVVVVVPDDVACRNLRAVPHRQVVRVTPGRMHEVAKLHGERDALGLGAFDDAPKPRLVVVRKHSGTVVDVRRDEEAQRRIADRRPGKRPACGEGRTDPEQKVLSRDVHCALR